MTPAEPHRPRPARDLAILAIVVIAVAVATFYVAKATQDDDDDDRPPIIVRNGSIHVEAALYGGDGQKGTIEPEGAAKIVWLHKVTDKPAKKIEVAISGIDPTAVNTCSASPYFFAQKVKSATIEYRHVTQVVPGDETQDVTENRTLTISLDKENLRLGLDAGAVASQDAAKQYTLDVDKETSVRTTMTSVTVAFSNSSNSSNTVTCTFDQSAQPQVMVLQRTK